jgi:hypothetical protein
MFLDAGPKTNVVNDFLINLVSGDVHVRKGLPPSNP